MAINRPFGAPTGLTLPCSLERFDTDVYDFATNSFTAGTPATLTQNLLENAQNPGLYRLIIASTPVATFPDGLYTGLINYNGQWVPFEFPMANGDDGYYPVNLSPATVYSASTTGGVSSIVLYGPQMPSTGGGFIRRALHFQSGSIAGYSTQNASGNTLAFSTGHTAAAGTGPAAGLYLHTLTFPQLAFLPAAGDGVRVSTVGP